MCMRHTTLCSPTLRNEGKAVNKKSANSGRWRQPDGFSGHYKQKCCASEREGAQVVATFHGHKGK